MEDNSDEFPSVGCIPDVMLRRVDPKISVLVAYIANINPFIETEVLLPKYAGGPSKKSKSSKKGVKASTSKPSPEPVEKVVKISPKKVVNPVTQPIVEETTHAKETLPTKSSMLKHLKKMAHRLRHSPDRINVKDVKSKIIYKPQLTTKGVAIREIPTHVSPASKKRMDEDMGKHISKNNKKVVQDYLEEVVPKSDFDDTDKSQSPSRDIDMGISSPTRALQSSWISRRLEVLVAL